MARTLVTPPTVEPISVAEAKSHLRVEISTDDTLIGNLIAAARQHAETALRRALITQTWDLFLDAFPSRNGAISVPLPPLQTIDSIKYVDTFGVTRTLTGAKYKVDAATEPARVVPTYDEDWPETREEINAVTVRFTAGYGDAGDDVPEKLRQAMLLMIGHWYENREEVVIGGVPAPIPFAAKSLFRQEQVLTFPR